MTSKIFQTNHQNRWFNIEAVDVEGSVIGLLELAIRVVALAIEILTINHCWSGISSDWIASIGWQNVIFIYWTFGIGCGMVYLATRMSASVVSEASPAARSLALIVEWSHWPPTLVIGVESLDTDWWHQSLE